MKLLAGLLIMLATITSALGQGFDPGNRSPKLSLCSPNVAVEDPTIGVMPIANSIFCNWKNAGLATQGGIPTRNTVCATVNPRGAGLSDAANIQSALDSCTVGQVVVLGSTCLPTCAFEVHMADLPIQIHSGITMRGGSSGSVCANGSTPYCQTKITLTDGVTAYSGGLCSGGTCTNQIFISMAPIKPQNDIGWSTCLISGTGLGCGAVALAADYAQGATTIQVAQTSAFTVGMRILIDEASGASYQTDPNTCCGPTGGGTCSTIWAASDWQSAGPSPATGRVSWPKGSACSWDYAGGSFPTDLGTQGCFFSYCDRVTAEIHEIASIGAGPCPGVNCTLTFTDPLTIAFRISGSHNAQVYYGPQNQSGGTYIGMIEKAGLENISVLRAAGGASVQFTMCAYCWTKNVEISEWFGGGIVFFYSWRTQVESTYINTIWYSNNSGAEYGMRLDFASTEILVENSIITGAGKSMVARAGGAGSVIAYNYFDDTYYTADGSIGDWLIEFAANASHSSGPHHVLFEGNDSQNCDASDNTHGNTNYSSYFRNSCRGYRTPFTDPSNSLSVNDLTGVGWTAGGSPQTPSFLRACGTMEYAYWHAFVGNACGVQGTTTSGAGWTYQGDWTSKRIWALGWNDFNGGQDSNLTSAQYMFRHHNYDAVNNNVVDDQAGYLTSLPNSVFLAATPSYFGPGASCTYTYPWIQVNGSANPVKTNSCAGSGLPAKARWNAGTPFVQP